ncbi:MAG: hypothetical protein A2Y62_18825 [Candidatus Fischerbacteria bacterium RBG_13_37_8]|uniref:Uncharacterized protein n=1 Tax=Candidatus Fischerbacteria bacterium RBG_13_37_8 TaxID=1817863 RepID=A0A1F5VKX6_9BACT|nr:MAG: hypothetical protein A2Y62_18825 [Candidatus Fischerbacteria bacterium RBG_13_37_8]
MTKIFIAKFSKEFIEKTLQIWQPYSSTKLTEEDAREIAENMTELFSLLAELEKKYKENGKEDHLDKADERKEI